MLNIICSFISYSYIVFSCYINLFKLGILGISLGLLRRVNLIEACAVGVTFVTPEET